VCCEGVLCHGTDWFTCFGIPVRSTKGPTPSPSNHPSRPSFDNVQDTFRYLIEEAPADHRTAKDLVSMVLEYSCLPLMKLKALLRDGYRCMITHRCDLLSLLKKVPDAVEFVEANPSAGSGRTELAHIFPPSTNKNMGEPEEDTDKACAIVKLLLNL